MSNTKTDNKTQRPIQERDIDPSQFVTVVSGCQGKLIYRSARTNERYEWDSFGAEQELELRELKVAKNSAKDFFVRNWWMFKPGDEWVIDYLGVRQYYKNAVSVDEFDSIFSQSPAKLKKTLEAMSSGQRQCALVRATEMISNGEIDSLKTISVLEEALGVKFAE